MGYVYDISLNLMHFICKWLIVSLTFLIHFFTGRLGKYKQFSISFLNNMYKQVLLLFLRKHLFALISHMTLKSFLVIVRKDDI